MPERHQKLAGMGSIIPAERGADVVPQHVPDALRAMWPREQILRERDGRDFRDVLVLGDSEDFRFVEVAHGHAVLQRDHRHLANQSSCLPISKTATTGACADAEALM